ncbi:MAG: GFA family protein [Solirubrobacteraceae bacterium]|nr:GFA family protein [Solirubrobacteraceae bacterium]
MSPDALTGGCLCGAVRFELTEPPAIAGYCHCTRCQRRTGTSSSAQALVDRGALTIVQGEQLVQGWCHPDGGMEKCFCRSCGAHLFSRAPDGGARMTVRLSAFDADPGVRPSFRAFVADAASWEPIPDDGLERFEEARAG